MTFSSVCQRTLLATGLLAALAGGVTALQAETASQAPGSTADELTAEAVQARVDAVQEDASLAEEVRSRALASYAQALADLEEAKTRRAKASEFERQALSAPDALAAAQAKLAEEFVDEEPAVGPEATLAEVEQGLRLAEAKLKSLGDEASELASAPNRRSERLSTLPKAIVDARQELEDVEEQLALPPVKGVEVVEAAATRIRLQARRELLEAGIESSEKELASYAAGRKLLEARTDLVNRQVAHARHLAEAWRALVEQRRVEAARQAKREASVAQRAVEDVHPLLAGVATRNAELARKRSELAGAVEELADRADSARVDLNALELAQRDAQRYVEVGGLTDSVGLLLRELQSTLAQPRKYLNLAEEHENQIAQARLSRLKLQKERNGLAPVRPLDQRVEEILVALGADAEPDERRALETDARALLEAQRGYLGQLLQDIDRQVTSLFDLETAERRLAATLGDLRGYIDERVLWVPSSPPIWAGFEGYGAALAWIVTPSNWADSVRTFARDTVEHPLRFGIVVALAAWLIASLATLRRRLHAAGQIAERRSCREIRPTVAALGYTILIAVIVPGFLFRIGWRLQAVSVTSMFGSSAGAALCAAAQVFLRMNVLKYLCRRGGLGEAHFGWSPARLSVVRPHITLLMWLTVPAAFVVGVLEAQDEEVWKQSLGRLGLIVYLAAVAYFLHRILGPRRGVLATAQTRSTFAVRSIYLLSVGVPVSLVLMAVSGYYFTALQLTLRLQTSLGLVIAAVVIHGFAGRWLLLARRRLAFRQMREKREAARNTEGGEEIEIKEEELDLASVDKQSRNLIFSFVTIGVLIGVWAVWADVVPALHFLDRFELWTGFDTVMKEVPAADGVTMVNVAEQVPVSVSLGEVLFACVVLLLTGLAARNVPGLLAVTILQRLSIQKGERYAVATLAKYLIIAFGTFFALRALQIGWSKLQWLAAAVSVGLGFGLQEIFANFVSGLILLFERPLRVGDFVTVGETNGRVSRIRMRATTITDYDRREMIVPNKEFITGRMVNWTLSDSITRIVLPVGIAYGSDTDRAAEILMDIARTNTMVLDEPEPSAVFTGFGDSSLDFKLRVFIPERDLWPDLMNAINSQIHRRFAEAEIEIAFPQRDLHLRSAEPLTRLMEQNPGFRLEQFGAAKER